MGYSHTIEQNSVRTITIWFYIWLYEYLYSVSSNSTVIVWAWVEFLRTPLSHDTFIFLWFLEAWVSYAKFNFCLVKSLWRYGALSFETVNLKIEQSFQLRLLVCWEVIVGLKLTGSSRHKMAGVPQFKNLKSVWDKRHARRNEVRVPQTTGTLMWN